MTRVALAVAERDVLEARSRRPRTMSGAAPGGSPIAFGRAMVAMPFSIVPTLSKSEVIERRIQPDIWLSRSASALAAATAPSVTAPAVQSQIESAAAGEDEERIDDVSAAVIVTMARFMARAASSCRSNASRPNASSRSAWAKSFTERMLVKPSTTRPVSPEFASDSAIARSRTGGTNVAITTP